MLESFSSVIAQPRSISRMREDHLRKMMELCHELKKINQHRFHVGKAKLAGSDTLLNIWC